MNPKKIQIVRLRLNPERNIWDRKIVSWLETIPLGYRSKFIKEALVSVISERGITVRGTSSHQDAFGINEQINKLFKFPD